MFNARVSFYDGVFSMDRPISTRIKPLPDGTVRVEKFEYPNMTRKEHINFCKTEGKYCGLLIQLDGWKIKDDYPW